MELILLENILKLGKIGDKVVVKDGYGRNFLLKFGKALRSSSENEELVNFTNENLNINNQSDEIFKIKTRDAIYLEIYKKARKKAKEIRNNAIAAFLEAKKIKIKYNLEDISDSDESDESDKNDL